MTEQCNWSQDDCEGDNWTTRCGQYFRLDEGGPVDNGMEFCCFCGKPTTQTLWTDEDDEGEEPQ